MACYPVVKDDENGASVAVKEAGEAAVGKSATAKTDPSSCLSIVQYFVVPYI